MSHRKWLVALAVPLWMGSAALALAPAGPSINVTPNLVSKSYVSRISWDGQTITFQNGAGYFDGSGTTDDIYKVSPDGTGLKKLTTRVSLPGVSGLATSDVWASPSPDGSKVMFYEWTNHAIIAEMDLASGTTRVISTDNSNNAFQSYSPDGSKIVFMSSRPGIGYSYNLWVMKAEPESATNVPVQLTTGGGVGRPSFSADGKLIYYVTGGNIWQVPVDGSAAPSQVATLPSGKTASDPTQPVAGGPILFYMAGQDGKWHIYSVNPDGTNLHQFTGADYDEYYCSAGKDKLVVTVNDYAKYGFNNPTVAVYTLTDATGNGTVTGTLTGAGNQPMAGATVDIYDGVNLVQTVKTDTNGVYTATLPAGGYCLKFYGTASDGTTVNTEAVWRGVAVPPNGTVTKNAFTTPLASERPANVIPSIQYPQGGNPVVSVRWGAGNAPAAGYSVTGYNVYRASSENGPWTKVGNVTTPAPYEFVDQNPGDLSSAFYTVATVTSNGTDTVESAYADVAQAANNLVFNGSFEDQWGDATQTAKGWDTYDTNQHLWGGQDGDLVYGTTTDDKTDGTRSAYIELKNVNGGTGYMAQDWAHHVGITPGDSYIFGVYARSTKNPAGTAYMLPGFDRGNVFGDYYRKGGTALPTKEADTLVGFETKKLTDTTANPNSAWTYLFPNGNTQTIDTRYPANAQRAYEFADHTNLSLMWTQDPAVTAGQRVLFDDVRYQVRRFGATGTISGRIQQKSANPVACTVSAAGKTVHTDPYRGNFVLTDIPTGMVDLTISNSGSVNDDGTPKDIKITVPNYGGYMLGPDYTFWDASGLPLKVVGHVTLWDGTPVAGATVTAKNDSWFPDQVATTDANGYYELPGPAGQGMGSWNYSTLTTTKEGYATVSESVAFGLAGITEHNVVIPPSYPFQIAKTTTAPTIDGVVNPSEWAKSQAIPLAFSGDPIQFPRWPTTAYALWDDSNLYLAFVGTEPNPAGLAATADAANPGRLWTWNGGITWNGDDIYAFWIAPANTLDAEYWQIMANSADFSYSIAYLPAWTPTPLADATEVSKVGTNQWSQEWKIPFSSLNIGGLFVTTPNVGDKWLFNLQRQRHQPEPDGEGSGTNWSEATFVNTITPAVKGDLNNDGQVTNSDASLALRILAGLDPLGSRLFVADVTGNGSVNADDVVMILRKANGLGGF